LFFLVIGIAVLFATGIVSVSWDEDSFSIHINRTRAMETARDAGEKVHALGVSIRESVEPDTNPTEPLPEPLPEPTYEPLRVPTYDPFRALSNL